MAVEHSEGMMVYRIAIVDDDKNLLESLGYMLKSEGFAVDSYSNGEQALHGIRGSSIDLVILDLCMPNIPRFNRVQKIKRNDTIPFRHFLDCQAGRLL